MIRSNIITQPAEEPLTLEALKGALLIDSSFTDRDDELTMLITSARMTIEKVYGFTFIDTEREMILDYDDCSFLNISEYRRQYLHYPPIISVSSIKLFDISDVELELTVDEHYKLYSNSDYIDYLDSILYLDFTMRDRDSLSIKYNCGYADADSVPVDLKYALLSTCKNIDNCNCSANEACQSVSNVFNQYRSVNREMY